jgi:hypothetical protein
MTLADDRLSNSSAVAGYVWRIAAGMLLNGFLRSHRCDQVSPAAIAGLSFSRSTLSQLEMLAMRELPNAARSPQLNS